MSSRIKNLAQRRALFAYKEVKKVAAWKNEEERKEFKSHVKDIPMMIKTNGLAAAFAFVFSKSDKRDYKTIGQITKQWLETEKKFMKSEGGEDFYVKLLNLDPNQSRMAIREIMALFTWLKRYADGMINKESE